MDLLSALPVEASRSVLDLLPPRDLGSCSGVSMTWRALVDCPLLWRRRCRERGWTDTDFVDQERSHRTTPNLREEPPLWRMNDWAVNFRIQFMLPVSWERNDSRSYQLSPSESRVVSFSCDERLLAVGHSNGTVSILDVWRLPRLRATLDCVLHGFAVLGLQVSGRRLVVLQSKLLQIYTEEDSAAWRLVDAKSFEMGFPMVEALERFGGQAESIGEWYAGRLSGDRHTKDSISSVISFQIVKDVVYVAVRDFQMIYGWSLDSGKRVRTVHVPSRTCKLRDMTVHDGRIYILYASRSVRHITAYELDAEKFVYEITTPECKTQKLMAGQYLIGVAISGPGRRSHGMIKVWKKADGKELASRATGLVSFRSVAEVYDLVVYGEARTVYVWQPSNDSILRSFSFGEVISFLLPCPFRFLLVVGTGSSWLCDWILGTQLYRVFPQVAKSGDYRGLIYADPTMLLLKIDSTVIEMITYC